VRFGPRLRQDGRGTRAADTRAADLSSPRTRPSFRRPPFLAPAPLPAVPSLRSGLRFLGFLAALAGILTLLFGVPAFAFGVSDRWQVWTAALLYFVFFTQGTGVRALRHGGLADRKRDRQVRSTGGRVAALLTLPGMLAAHAISIFSLSSVPADLRGGLPLAAVAGIGIALIGLAVNYQATRTLGRFFDRLAIQDAHTLVTHGIYGVVRHPIYSSYLCLFFSVPLLTQSLWGAFAMAGVSALWFGSRIPTEEAMLEETFGTAYRDYRARTRRLIPFVL
jgi:protein-S-isoprenylcysteine O-methyltransferase Ste14